MELERIWRLLTGVMTAAGAILAALGALSADATTIGLGLVAALGGGVLYWASGWFWGWYWDWLERLQSGEVEPTATLRASLLLLFVAVGTGGFAGLWWLADLAGVVTDGMMTTVQIAMATVLGGVVPGLVFGGGFFAVARVLRYRNESLDVTKGSRGIQLITAIVLCTLGTYCLLLFLHPPSAVAFAIAYLVSFVAGAVVYLTQT